MTSPLNSDPPEAPQKPRNRRKRVLIWVAAIVGAFMVLGFIVDATGAKQTPKPGSVAEAQTRLSPTPSPVPSTTTQARTSTPVPAPTHTARAVTTSRRPAVPPSASAPIIHHVIYQFGLNGTPRGDDLDQIGLGWNDPNTGQHELPPETSASSTTPLHFPYVVQFDVTNLTMDNQHISAGTNVGTPDITVDCTIIVDGQVLDAEAGTTATMNSDGTVETSGSADCMPNH